MAAMTPPPAAAALAAALEAEALRATVGVTDNAAYWPRIAQLILAALAASGWQVTREGEGLRAALRELLTLSDDMVADWDAWHAAWEQARAALAGGEEGQ